MRHVAKIILKTKASHYLGLIIWSVPLLLFNNGQHSLMPHDEAIDK